MATDLQTKQPVIQAVPATTMPTAQSTSAMDAHTLCAVFDCPQINEVNTQSFLQTISGNLTPDINHLYLMLNTPGGGVNLGILIYNYLRSLPIKVTTHNIGQVDSIGNVVFMAGNDRYATSNSTFLFHGIASGQWGGLSVAKAKEAISQLENDENRMTAILRERTKFLTKDLKAFYDEGKSISPAVALDKGVITEVRQAEIHPAARLVIIPTAIPNR